MDKSQRESSLKRIRLALQALRNLAQAHRWGGMESSLMAARVGLRELDRLEEDLRVEDVEQPALF